MATNRASGHISFRLPVETHEQLLEVAGYLGVDLTALLNQMLREILPKFRKRARKVAQEEAEARLGWQNVAMDMKAPLVARLLDAGRSLPADQRLAHLVDLAVQEGQCEGPGLEAVLHAILSLLRQEDEKKAVKEALERRTRQAGRPTGRGG